VAKAVPVQVRPWAPNQSPVVIAGDLRAPFIGAFLRPCGSKIRWWNVVATYSYITSYLLNSHFFFMKSSRDMTALMTEFISPFKCSADYNAVKIRVNR
jgi:hypothetical protein